ncbi:hypothetical protein AXG93_2772s1100 [Marchantia polymorpha subsp. ruderalis]|uniref:RNA helicase n=1 Tax=Marchantia polymorpha subsp. ruderalis TaxID=1480154 RepID=A0A176WHE3_MARPO|nr:hypothetical protein AXG93_2772s1100 [Marchantia polymorpha subsp. ruderalis]
MPSMPISPSLENGKRKSSSAFQVPEPKRLKYGEASRRSELLEQRRSLPIASASKKLVEEVQKNDTLIVIGETGSGKTTRYCKFGSMVGITQPRRVAAITVATRVAEEMGVQLSKEVGYSIRFEDATSSQTKLKFMTDGMLLREALLDPLLQKYSVIILDEAHERTIHTDVLFGLLKGVQARRREVSKVGTDPEAGDQNKQDKTVAKASEHQTQIQSQMEANSRNGNSKIKQLKPLKVIIMSATLDAQGFSEYFNGAKAVYVQGRQYPVQIMNTYTAEADYLDAALITTLQVHQEELPGDILVFLTGQEEIENMERLLTERIAFLPEGSRKILVAPIYAALPSEQQMRVFEPAPSGYRKVILATNIAETSLTIPGIRYVIDPGLVKAKAYNPRIGVESLAVVPISKAQAAQRSGRAGREGPGKCFRLYTVEAFNQLQDATVPEIKRCNLASVMLQLKALGIDDVLGFDFMDKPSRAAIVKSLEHLYTLGALTDEGKLSDPLGVQMARFPLEPLYAKAMLVSSSFKCSEEMLTTVAMLSAESIFFTPREKFKEANAARQRFSSPEGDHITLINVLRAYTQEVEGGQSLDSEAHHKKFEKKLRGWCSTNFINGRSLRRALDIRRQVRGYVEGMGLELVSCGDDFTHFRRCLTASFFLNSAHKQADGKYRALSSGQTVAIHPSSVLFGKKPDCVIFNELVRTNQQYIRSLTRIDSLWLAELAPQYYSTRDVEDAARPTTQQEDFHSH